MDSCLRRNDGLGVSDGRGLAGMHGMDEIAALRSQYLCCVSRVFQPAGG